MPRSRTAPVTYTPEVQAVEPPKMAREGKSKTNPAVVKALAEGEWNGYKGLGFAGPDKNSASNEAARYKRAVEAEPGYGPKSLKSRVWKQDDGKWTFALTLRKPATPATEPAA